MVFSPRPVGMRVLTLAGWTMFDVMPTVSRPLAPKTLQCNACSAVYGGYASNDKQRHKGCKHSPAGRLKLKRF
jgi:hypothetical protein